MSLIHKFCYVHSSDDLLLNAGASYAGVKVERVADPFMDGSKLAQVTPKRLGANEGFPWNPRDPSSPAKKASSSG